jgi:hypothetical protein
MRSAEDDIKLIREAIKDWGEGKLGDFAALYAIHIIVNKTELTEDFKKWANEAVKKFEQEKEGESHVTT